MANEEKIKELREILDKSQRIVFFGGAGVSTESGLPDFRSEDGLYNAKLEYNWTPEEMLSHSFFVKHTDVFYDYFKNHLVYRGEKKPNKAHYALVELEKQGKLLGIVTQNVDGLHQLAGSTKIFELHGSARRNTCTKCGKKFDLDYVMDESNCENLIPHCDKCGAIIKPDVVLYEEPLDPVITEKAVEAIAEADTMIIGGTSLAVYPAASYINYFNGDNLVVINKTPTYKKAFANLEINAPVGETLGAAMGI